MTWENRIVGYGTEKPDQLMANPMNWRIHPKQQQAVMSGVLKEVGWVQDVIVNKTTGHMVDGHLRVELALKQNQAEVPVKYVELTEAEEALILATFDPISHLATQETDILRALSEEIETSNADIIELLADLLGPEPEVEEEEGLIGDDEVPESDEEDALVKRGDLWQLGDHLLMCGDASSIDDLDRLMDGELADLVFTDPPYNLASENDLVGQSASDAYKDLAKADWDKDFDLVPVLNNLYTALADDVVVYVCTSHHLAPVIWDWMKSWADHYQFCVWSKPDPMPSLMKRHWTWDCELVPYATRGKHVFNPDDGKHSPSTWRINKNNGKDKTGHPTQKPVAVPLHAITKSSRPGQIVLDLFGGSGSTLIACQKMQRRAKVMEIDPGYCETMIRRWEQFTGLEAVKRDA